MFAELYEFNEQLLLSMKFGRDDLRTIAKKFGHMRDVIEGRPVLKGADGEFLKNYAENLGATDAFSQIDYLSERKEYIKRLKDESSADYKKYSSLYLKIFFMLGILIAVLIA